MSINPNALFRQQALEKLRSPEQLNTLLTVASPRSWLVLLALSALIVAAVAWGIFGRVETTITGRGVLSLSPAQGRGAEAVLFVPVENSGRIQGGMTVRLSLVAGRGPADGYVWGYVAAVNESPSTRAGMLASVKNDALVDALVGGGQLIEVRVPLIADASVPGGYLWTIRHQHPVELREGAVLNGTVIVGLQRPIEFALPFVGRLLQT